jgi:hypothetical protein
VDHYAAIDVSLERSSVCIVDTAGKVVKESKVETHPEALVKFFKDFRLPLTRISLEAPVASGRLDIAGPIRVVHQLRRPTADETLVDCPRVVGTEVGLSLVRVSPN